MRFPRLAVAPLALASVLAAAVTGCSDTAAPGSTQLSVVLTDAPGDLQAAVVTISQIDLVGGSGGPIVLSNTETTTDLLTLANATQTLVSDFEVPAGKYTQLRFVVTGGYIQVDNGDGTSSLYATPNYGHVPAGATVTGTLQMPSFGQSGLKVTMPGDALELSGPEKILLVDFDVSESFGHQAGGSGGWVMHPVIHGAELTSSGTVDASLKLGDGISLPMVGGTAVTLADFAAVLTASDGSTTSLPLTDTDGDGTFDASFAFVLPGDYTVTFTGPTGLAFETDPAGAISVTVGSGQTASASAQVTAAAAS